MKNSYALITSAKNEAKTIERTILSVVGQTSLPSRWIIVSDGSTDATDEIVKKYSKDYWWISYYRRSAGSQRNFSSKVLSVNLAIEQLKGSDYAFIGILDADIGLPSEYYAKIIKNFSSNPRLGLAGGQRFDQVGKAFRKVRCSSNSVGGSVQFFRRSCIDQIGQFIPLHHGGEDAIAEIIARRLGWQVCTFKEIEFYHYRQTGTAGGSIIRAAFNTGIKNYEIGYHPLFLLFRCIYRMVDQPIIISSLLEIFGYAYACYHQIPHQIPLNTLKYLRREQTNRLKAMLTN